MRGDKEFIARLAAHDLPPDAWKPGELEKFCQEYAEGEMRFDFERRARTIHVVIAHIFADFRDTRGKKARYKLLEYRNEAGKPRLRYAHEGSASEKLRFACGESWEAGLVRCLDEELKLRHRKPPFRLIERSDLRDLQLFPGAQPAIENDRESGKYPSAIKTCRHLYQATFTMPAAFRRREGYVEMNPDGETIRSWFVWRLAQRFRGRIEDAAPVDRLEDLYR
jgi:hypothetical protein